jgi:hypothetical protein
VAADENPESASGVLSAQSLTGLAPAQIGFQPGQLAGLTVLLGGGAILTVEHTPVPTTVLGGSNLTTLKVLGTEASLEYTAGQGVDSVQVGEGSVAAIRGHVLVRGSPRGNVNVTVDDSATTAERTVVISDHGISGLAPAEITLAAGANPSRNGLTIKSGHARGFYSVVDTPPLFAVAIHGQGLDVVNVAAVHQPFEVEGANGVSIGSSAVGLANIRDEVTIGPGGPTTVTIDDRGAAAARSATFDGNTVTGLTPRQISYASAALRTLHLLGGGGGNRIKVTGTRPGITTSLSLGTGADLIAVCATSGPLVLDAHHGAGHRVVIGSTAPDDTKAELQPIAGEVTLSATASNVDLIVGDGGGHVARRGELNQNGTPDLGPAAITWGPLHSLAFRLSRAGNAVLVNGSPSGGPATVWTGGRDKVEAKPSEEIPCDLFVEGSKPSEDTLRVLLEDRSAAVDISQPAGTEPGTIRITYRSGTTKVVSYRNIRNIIPPRGG